MAETLLLDFDHDSRVATVTLNRPDALNSFNRAMCNEMRDAWHAVKDDEGILDGMPGVTHLIAHGPVERVQRFGPVQRDRGDP